MDFFKDHISDFFIKKILQPNLIKHPQKYKSQFAQIGNKKTPLQIKKVTNQIDRFDFLFICSDILYHSLVRFPFVSKA